MIQNIINPILVLNFAGHTSLLTCPTTDYNPYSANLAGHASSLSCPVQKCEGFGHASTH